MPHQTTAAELINPHSLYLRPDDGVAEAARRLLPTGLDGAPVVNEEGELVGVFTLADVIFSEKQVHVPEPMVLFDAVLTFGTRKLKAELDKITAVTVAEAMNSPAITVGPDDSVAKVASLMVEKSLSVVPVIGANGRLRGTIGRRDVVKFVLDKHHED